MVSSVSSSGSNSLTELLTGAAQKRKSELFSKVDSNGDGGADRAEFSAFAKKLSKAGDTSGIDNLFSTYDADGDGKLSADELDKFARDTALSPGDMSGIIGQMNSQGVQQRFDELFNSTDSDGSGGISKSEFTTFAAAMAQNTGYTVDGDSVFSAYDSNGDGELSKDEMVNFVRDTAPGQVQQASAAYGKNNSNGVSGLVDMMKGLGAFNPATAGTDGGSSKSGSFINISA